MIRSTKSAPPGAFTTLERVVMEALASEIPGLAGQFARARPTVRRNTGFGVFTELLSPSWGEGSQSDRGGHVSDVTGEFGTVHVMVANLPDPVAFTARLLNGRVVGVNGDAYGQDTRAIDFGAAHFGQVFTLDDQNRSIPFQSRLTRAPEPAPAPRPPRPTSVPVSAEATADAMRQVNRALKSAFEDPDPREVKRQARAAARARAASAQTPSPAPAQATTSVATEEPTATLDLTSNAVVLRLVAALVVGFVVFTITQIFNWPSIIALFAAGWTWTILGKPKAMTQLKDQVAKMQAQSPPS